MGLTREAASGEEGGDRITRARRLGCQLASRKTSRSLVNLILAILVVMSRGGEARSRRGTGVIISIPSRESLLSVSLGCQNESPEVRLLLLLKVS